MTWSTSILWHLFVSIFILNFHDPISNAKESEFNLELESNDIGNFDNVKDASSLSIAADLCKL